MLKTLRRSIQNHESVLVLSYPMMEGEIFERNQKRVVDHPDDFRKVTFEGGMTFMTPFEYPQILPSKFKKDMVVNTYYSNEGFERLANEGGWGVVQSLVVSKYSDTKRCVVKLVPMGAKLS